MTTRKLTPAEALEVFRDWRAVERADMTSTAFYDKWGTFDHVVTAAIAALEEALAQKPPAADAPIIDIEPGTFVLEKSPPTEREMLDWLHERGNVEANTSKSVAQVWHQGLHTHCRTGCTLREALMRLVVAVAEREAKA